MPKFIIDLNAKRVPETLRIWRLFPGANYKFLKYFLEAGAVFFDFPGLVLPPGRLDHQTSEKKIDLRSRLLAMEAISAWIDEMRLFRYKLLTTSRPVRPSRDLIQYRGRKAQSGFSRELGGLSGLFGEASKGDLILVPGRPRDRCFYIGEFISSPEERITLSLGDRYEGESTPGRAVRWFSAIPEFRLPAQLLGMFRTQTAWLEVPDDEYLSFLDLTYGTYIFKQHFASQLHTLSELFDGQDALDLTILAKIAARLASDYEKGLKLDARITAVLDPIPADDQLSVSISINSPGYVITKAATIGPLALVALFVLLSSADASEPPAAVQVQVTNSAGEPDDPCVANVNKLVVGSLDVMGMDDWHKACELAKRLKTHPKLRSDAKIRKRDD